MNIITLILMIDWIQKYSLSLVAWHSNKTKYKNTKYSKLEIILKSYAYRLMHGSFQELQNYLWTRNIKIVLTSYLTFMTILSPTTIFLSLSTYMSYFRPLTKWTILSANTLNFYTIVDLPLKHSSHSFSFAWACG